jgi:hypothetical protein
MVVKETALRLAACNPPEIAQVRSKILAQVLILHTKKSEMRCNCKLLVFVCVDVAPVLAYVLKYVRWHYCHQDVSKQL